MTHSRTRTETVVTPVVGCNVHYVSHGSPVLPDGTQRYRPQCRAAIVTAVVDCEEDHDGRHRPCLSLVVFSPEGQFFPLHISHDDPFPAHPLPATRLGGTWHWPELP